MTNEERGKNLGQIIAKSWADVAFKLRLLTDATAVLKEEGVEIPEGVSVKVVENTDQVHHLIIPQPPEPGELSDDQLESVQGGLIAILLYIKGEAT
jgi:hypothetical protein